VLDCKIMNFDDEDRLELQFLAGGNIVEHAPVFSPDGRLLFKLILYSTKYVTS